MDRENLQTYIRSAGTDLGSVRRSLLLIAQTGANGDLTRARQELGRIQAGAEEHGLSAVAAMCSACENSLEALAGSPVPAVAFNALDEITSIEAALFDVPLDDEALSGEIDELLARSFEGIVPDTREAVEEFEIDEETLEIFRSEADELLTNISRDLSVLAATPGDQAALWNIRRNAHTFKGSAGIVGCKNASIVAHRMEDLLDKMVESRSDADSVTLNFLEESVRRLENMMAAGDAHLAGTMVSLSPLPVAAQPASTPIVRVSLDRLDELIKISQSLVQNSAMIAESFSPAGSDSAELLASQRQLTDEMHAQLLRVRLVRFGTLATRFSRAVSATCLDEDKKAVVVLEDADVEVDTQIIDALIEPLLHLLKNAIVHGIEAPETRRMIGKPEQGTVTIRLQADDEGLTLSVTDDGAGISFEKIKAKAVYAGVLDADAVAAISEEEAAQLIFERGLTTAEKIDLNAGRGVGMSIVREAVEARGGTVSVRSTAHVGTTFTIRMSSLSSSSSLSLLSLNKLKELKKPYELSSLVLIVDDSPTIRLQTTRLAEDAGLRVITAQNGADALELLLSGAHEPGLILSDIEMPQIDGWELLEYIKTDDNLGHIPVVMVSSLDAHEHRQRALDLGAADYVTKPISAGSITKYVLDLVVD